MTDYIQWLLEEEEENPPEETAPTRVPIPRRRRLAGLFGMGSRQTGVAGGGSVLPEDIRPHSVRATEGGLPGEEIGRGEAALDRQLGQSRPIWESLADAAQVAPGEEEIQGIKRGRGLSGLYTALQRAGRMERRIAGPRAAAPAVIIQEAPARGTEALGPLELDRCFEREARRYDNGFPLL